MKMRSFSRACLSLVGLVSASILVGCVAPGPEGADDTGVAAEALSLPTETYSFSKDIKFCETINYLLGSTKICSPGMSFAGSVSIGDYEDYPHTTQPVSALVTVDMNDPFNGSTSLRVGLLSSDGGVCYNASNVSGVDLEVCANAVDLALDATTRVLTFKMKLTVKGELEVEGVGISDTVDLFTTPTVSVPF